MNPLMTDYPLSTQPTPVIVALDFANEADTLAFVRRLSARIVPVKNRQGIVYRNGAFAGRKAHQPRL